MYQEGDDEEEGDRNLHLQRGGGDYFVGGTKGKGEKDLFGRTRSNPVFCSVTPSIGGTWDMVRKLMKSFGEGVYFADFVCLPPFMAFMVGNAFQCYIWAKFRRFNVDFR